VSRTTTDAVEALLLPGGDYEPAPLIGDPVDLQPFVDTASAIVDQVVVCATAKGVSLSTTTQELIERWLAAHAYVQSDQTFSQRKTLDASGMHHGQTGMRLENSKYGQMATTLDYSGCLSAMSKQARKRVRWGGKAPSEQIPYSDRS
jgi:hypothetical protein